MATERSVALKQKYRQIMLQMAVMIFSIVIGSAASAAAYIYEDGAGKLYVSEEKVERFGFKLVRVVGSRAFSPVTRPLPSKSAHAFNKANANNAMQAISMRNMSHTRSKHRNAAYFDAYIQRVAQDYKIDPALIKAIIHVESNFDVFAQSRAGAQGLMQIMPSTGDDYELYDPYDPLENIRAGTQHLRFLLDLFDENVDLALAAYNAGQGNVYKYQGIPPFAETQKYVVRVNAKYAMYRVAL